MPEIICRAPNRDHETQVEAEARRALNEAISYYGWDHPVVAGAQRTVMALRNRSVCRV